MLIYHPAKFGYYGAYKKGDKAINVFTTPVGVQRIICLSLCFYTIYVFKARDSADIFLLEMKLKYGNRVYVMTTKILPYSIENCVWCL